MVKFINMIAKKSFIFIIALMSATSLAILEKEWKETLANRNKEYAWVSDPTRLLDDDFEKKLLEEYNVTLSSLVEEFTLKFAQLRFGPDLKKSIKDWLKDKIKKTIDSRFGDLDSIEKLIVEKYSSVNGDGQSIESKFSSLANIEDVKNIVSKAYFLNLDRIDGDVCSFHYLEVFPGFYEYFQHPESRRIELTREAYGYYKTIFNRKVKDYTERYGVDVPEQIKEKLNDLEAISGKLSSIDRKRFEELSHIKPKLRPYYQEIKFMILRVLTGQVKSVEEVESIKKDVIDFFSTALDSPRWKKDQTAPQTILSMAFAEMINWSVQLFFQKQIDQARFKFVIDVFGCLANVQLRMGEPRSIVFEHLNLLVKNLYNPPVNSRLTSILDYRLS